MPIKGNGREEAAAKPAAEIGVAAPSLGTKV